MNFIKCPKCGREEPSFDYAHICGPVEVKPSMNLRIMKLAEQAGFDLGNGQSYKVENFAELIVKECLSQVDKVDAMLDDDKEKTGVAWVGLAIAKHFGVE